MLESNSFQILTCLEKFMRVPFPAGQTTIFVDPHGFHQRMKNMLDGGVVGIFHLYHIM